MSPDHGLDRLLDRTLIPGYSRLGYRIRRRSWDSRDPRPGALAGQRALVTGAASGIGEATALGLARLGATVHLLARSHDRAEPARGRIAAVLEREGRAAALETEACDVADLAAVEDFAAGFAERLTARDGALDLIVHNAGVMPPERTRSVDGYELSVACHVLGPVLMTERLGPALARSTDGARVVLMSSGGMYARALPVDDPGYAQGRYRPATAYARSKRMQVELAPVLAARWAAQRTRVYVMHPGWVDTPGIASSLALFRAATRRLLRDAEAGADTAIWLAATHPSPPAGGFWHDRAERPTDYLGLTRSSRADVDRFAAWALAAAGLD